MRPGVLRGGIIGWPLSFVLALLLTSDLRYSLALATVATSISMFLMNIGGR